MFTGIVEGVGEVISKSETAESIRLVVASQLVASDAYIGASVSHNGCCLTIAHIEGPYLSYDLLRETEQKTNFPEVRPGSKINLERSVQAQTRLGGHFVTGHVDSTGVIRKFSRVGKDHELVIEFPSEYGAYVVPKGCIAVDGMSLTVVEVTDHTFSIWVIPHTLEVTCLGERRVGDRVNLEFDLLAKYTQKILATRGIVPEKAT